MATVLDPKAYQDNWTALTPIQGKPTYDKLRHMRDTLKTNAASITSMRGGGTNGYVGLVVTAAVYATIAAGTPFNRPAAPPIHPVIPAGSSAAQIGELVRRNVEAQREFNECNNVEKALKAQLEQAIEAPYLVGICNHTTGFANVTLRAMLAHLFTNYGTVSAVQLQANEAAMSKELDPNTPIELLFVQIEEAEEFAEDGNAPYTNIQVINKAYNLIFRTSPFKRACRRWNERPAAEKTWANFKTHFSAAQVALQEEMDTETAGYHGANSMTNQDNLQNQQAAALANLATAVASDRQAFDVLTTTNLELN